MLEFEINDKVIERKLAIHFNRLLDRYQLWTEALHVEKKMFSISPWIIKYTKWSHIHFWIAIIEILPHTL